MAEVTGRLATSPPATSVSFVPGCEASAPGVLPCAETIFVRSIWFPGVTVMGTGWLRAMA